MYNDYSELIAATQNSVDGTTLNAQFTNPARALTAEENRAVSQQQQQILAAEKAFRTADDVLLKQQKQFQAQLNAVVAKRQAAMHAFDKNKAALEAPLKSFGITTAWDEPQTDMTHIDVDV